MLEHVGRGGFAQHRRQILHDLLIHWKSILVSRPPSRGQRRDRRHSGLLWLCLIFLELTWAATETADLERSEIALGTSAGARVKKRSEELYGRYWRCQYQMHSAAPPPAAQT